MYLEKELSSPNDALLPLSTQGWAACRLTRRACTGYEDNSYHKDQDNLQLWAPVILKRLPSHPHLVASTCACDIEHCELTPNQTRTIGDDTTVNERINESTKIHQMPTLFIPPCLVATLGLHNLFYQQNHHHSTIAYLQHLPTTEIQHASHATVREIGRPPPAPIMKWPSTSSSVSSDDRSNDEEKQLRKFFLRPSFTAVDYRVRNRSQENDNDIYTNSNRTTSKATKSKPRQRLLALGSIFAVPLYDKDDANDDDDDDDIACETNETVEEVDNTGIQNVRFYQVMEIQSSSQDNGDTIHSDCDNAEEQVQNMMAYIISPSTHLVLIPPRLETTDRNDDPISNNDLSLHPQLKSCTMMHGYTWRLPRPTMVVSFLRSVSSKLANHPLADKCVEAISTTPSTIHHPSAQALGDALYLQGASSFISCMTIQNHCHVCHNILESTSSSLLSAHFDSDPRIIHIIGKEENHVRACVDEAADISCVYSFVSTFLISSIYMTSNRCVSLSTSPTPVGMRSFHVEGLAAFWAHYSLFNTFSQPREANSSFTPQLTGALPDKLRGLSAALDLARQSSPCVLHIVDVDHELSSTEGHSADLDTRKDEERRIVEAIRAGSYGPGLQTTLFHGSSSSVGGSPIMTTPLVIVVMSTSRPLPPGPLSSSILQRSIEISAPDVNYARLLWDNDADGTFEYLSSYLVGLPAREIRCLRESFIPLWKAGGELEQSSPLDILQTLLPELDTRRSFLQSSRSNGSSSTLPLSSSSIPNVRWEDIGGLESIRKEIMDAVELPLKYPHYFEGSRRSGILLFGPPGTGAFGNIQQVE